MSRDYRDYLNKLVADSIDIKWQINDAIFGMKELSGKLDTLIALKQAELTLLQQQQAQQCQKESP